jgi:hypothetical protein
LFGFSLPGPTDCERIKFIYYSFDLFHLDGYDLRHCGLEDRKAEASGDLRPPRGLSVVSGVACECRPLQAASAGRLGAHCEEVRSRKGVLAGQQGAGA